MTEIASIAQVATRAADLADRCEVVGCLVAAALLREIARDVEEAILEKAPPDVVGWMELGRTEARPG